jgi:hypothetical protein
MVKVPRTFPAPALVGGGAYTVDELEMLSHGDDDLAIWAGRTYRRERDNLLASLSADTSLPYAVVEYDDFGHERIVGLEYSHGVYTVDGWQDHADFDARSQLNADEAAFAARAFNEGIDQVYVRPFVPAAWLDEPVTAAAAPEGLQEGLPDGALIVAVVDELDKNAVLELIAIAPGPKAWRRHDTSWREDDLWLHNLKSVRPPPVVKIEDAELLASVVAQVDTATAGKPFDKSEEEKMEEKPVTSALLASIEAADVEAAIDYALTAASVGKKAQGKAGGAERLRQYWLHGKGAAKIRWGTPGDWTRCYKHLSKHMGPRAKGYCQLMHGRATGTWAGRNQKKTPNPAVSAEARAKQSSR